MEEHSRRDANEDGTDGASVPRWPSILPTDLGAADPLFLALLDPEVSIPAIEPIQEKLCAQFCPTCRSGGRCAPRARAKDFQHEYELEAERARLAERELGLEAEHKRLAFETLEALRDDWEDLTRAEQDQREGEYRERFRTLLVILGADSNEALYQALLTKVDAPVGGRPRIIETEKELDNILIPNIKEMIHDGQDPSAERVADYLQGHALLTQHRRGKTDSDARQLRTWVKDHTGLDWTQYLKSRGFRT